MSKVKHLLAAFAALCVLLIAQKAHATHFRYGNITWVLPDPVGAPTTVRFEVTTAWRADYVDSTTLIFGDGKQNPLTKGQEIGDGTDAAGLKYKVTRYVVTHTYPGQGQYVASFTSCCRLSNIVNAGDESFLVEAKVDLSPGNTGNPVTAVPAIIQLQTNGVRTINIPATQPDGRPVTCRFATLAESMTSSYASDTLMPPVIAGSGNTPSVSVSASPPGCTLTWNTQGALAGQQYAVALRIESSNGGKISSATLDFIVEMVLAPPPTCSGSGAYTIEMGDSFTHDLIGTKNAGGPNLIMNLIGTTGTISPNPGSTAPSPFTTKFNWSPGLGEEGTSVVTVVYTDSQNASGFCSLTLIVPECPQFGSKCDAGVGACNSPGINKCNNGNVICTAVAGQPSEEVCDGQDNNCDGVTDENNPGAGVACATNLPGVCSTGITDCSGGGVACIPDIAPASVTESCNAIDDDCDGTVDEGFNTGSACSAGVGACQAQGVYVCDAGGASACNAVAGQPTSEMCNAVDDDCDGAVDNGFTLNEACTLGLGQCKATGVTVCDDLGGLTCNATAGQPTVEVCGNDLDEDCNDVLDNDCIDSDDDGLFDQVEAAIGTDKNDADSDDDGVKDGDEPSRDQDTDGDGLVNALDADSDNDGLPDGTEMGLDCGGTGTDAEAGHCTADADQGATKTDPLNADSDNGGATDGSEDSNLNGAQDTGEGDPTQEVNDAAVVDTDGDGLGDDLETFVGSDPNDGDTDDDGALDGDEANPSEDTDHDGLINLLDVDSDNDALFDGTELGFGCMNEATDTSKNHCRKDADLGKTTTGVLTRDSDKGGKSDGSEDQTLNGGVGSGEGNPLKKSDDASITDGDDDGLSDRLEQALGSKELDKDSDNDGLLDGEEPNPSDDHDGDGLINLLDPDSDGDGLFDGTEAGKNCSNLDTDQSALQCIADADGSTTTTWALVADTDGGSALDGDEDTNKNGAIEAGERDPNKASDDIIPAECQADADCKLAGRICEASACIDGCRGEGSNGCPDRQVCTSMDAKAGTCEDASATSEEPPVDGDKGGCSCEVGPRPSGFGAAGFWLVAAAGASIAWRRRRMHARTRA